MNDDGTVMRGPQLAAFAEREKLQRITIAELISYRQTRDKLIERSGEFPVESEIGTLTGYAFPDAVRFGLSHSFTAASARRADFAPRWHCGRAGRFYTEVRRHRVG